MMMTARITRLYLPLTLLSPLETPPPPRLESFKPHLSPLRLRAVNMHRSHTHPHPAVHSFHRTPRSKTQTQKQTEQTRNQSTVQNSQPQDPTFPLTTQTERKEPIPSPTTQRHPPCTSSRPPSIPSHLPRSLLSEIPVLHCIALHSSLPRHVMSLSCPATNPVSFSRDLGNVRS